MSKQKKPEPVVVEEEEEEEDTDSENQEEPTQPLTDAEEKKQVETSVFKEVFGDTPFPVVGPHGVVAGGTVTGPPPDWWAKVPPRAYPTAVPSAYERAEMRYANAMLNRSVDDPQQQGAYSNHQSVMQRIAARRARKAKKKAEKPGKSKG